MAFGLPASYSQLTPLNNLSETEFILIAIKIAKRLNWNLISVDKNQLIATSVNANTWNETILIAFDENAAIIQSSSNGNQFYDRGRNKKHTEAFLNLYFEEINDTSNINLDENSILETIRIEQENLAVKEDEVKIITNFYSFFSIFIPVKGYFITPILIHINIFYFLIMTFSGVHFFSPEIQDLIDWGGNYGPLTYENQWWRLLSACFIHIGFFHLITNCIALAYVGLLLEPYLKKWGFLITYLFCGVLASLTSLYWNKDMVSAGASGAIFGMYGILLITLIFNVLDKKINLRLLINIAVLIFINIGYSFKDGVDAAAHIGGLIAGIVFGLILCLLDKKRTIALIFISSSASILIVFLFLTLKSSQVYIYQVMEYQTRMQEFADMEKMALEAYSIPYGDSYDEQKESVLYMIKDRGIYYWNENITLLNELDKLYLPKEIHEQNERLIKYCKLRIDFYELAYKKVSEENPAYDGKMGEIAEQIESIIKEVNNVNEKNKI